MPDVNNQLNRQVPALSIIIPSHMEEKCIAYLLRDLENQTFKDFEVILVDTRADSTSEIAKEFINRLNLTIIDASKNKGVGRQRNIGAKYAVTNNLLFLDADGRVFNKSLEYLMSIIMDENPALILPIMLFNSRRPIDFIATLVINAYMPFISLFKTRVSGAFLYVRKNSFDRESGFNEALTFEEDFDLTQRIGESGGKFVRLWRLMYMTSTRTFDALGRHRYFGIQIWNGLITLLPNRIKHKLMISYELGGGKSSKLFYGKEHLLKESKQSRSRYLLNLPFIPDAEV